MKRNPVKTLQNKCERIWKDICYLKYGRFCHVKKFHPYIRLAHTTTIQIDHCITRANKHFFLDIWNGLPVCNSCNRAKSFKQKSVDIAIDEMVRKRNPEWYENAIRIDQTMKPNLHFSKIWWLEEKKLELEKELNKLKEK